CTACHDPHSAENLFGPNFTGSELCFADMLGTAFALEGLVSGTRLPAHLSLTSPPPRPAPAAPAAPAVAIARAEAPAPGPSTASPPAPAAVRLGPPPGTSASGRGCVTNECHASLVSAPVVHAPSGQGQCELCHVAVDEPNHKFRLAAKEPELCYQCHDRPPEARFLHGPVAQGLCTVCHNPHGAPHKSMLPEAGKDLCFNCHSEMGKLVLSARVQHPVEKDCNACHDPHRGDVKFQLRKDLPDLCIGCHPAVKDAVDAATVAHEPVVKDRKCVNCHNPHGTDVPKLLAAVEMDLCLGCHDKPMDTPSGPIIDMKSWLANNPERHGPIRNESCTGCHQPHGSKDFRLLRHAFPRAFYHPFSLEAYDLCFECHEKTLVLDQATTTLTGFRNGEKNLHYVHVNQKKGRTCRACHEVHAGTKPKRIRDFVPFGEWQYPVNFEVTENGGRCASGCHVTRAYDRLQEVVQK
ncbi:MAG: cytochrome c3 family protein, partial [Planctomycetes bacterium]|nr:cytochrome c3 family protein [Planctomycetota bacterium]